MTKPMKLPGKAAAQDPYLLWAKATDFRDYGGVPKVQVSVIFESTKVVGSELKLSNGATISISQAYQGPLPDSTPCAYFAAQIPLTLVDEFAKCVTRFELGLAVVPVDDKMTGTSIVPLADIEKRLIVGVIDDFIGFGHPRFQNRMERVWSQSDDNPSLGTRSSAWTACRSMGYGFQAVKPKKGALTLDDYPAHQKTYTHGSHVAGLILGDSPFQLEPPQMQQAAMVAVHLPKKVLRDTSGGAMAVQILDGIRYILSHAKIQDQIVINISYGTFAGPHDGTSLLELAIDQLVQAYGGRLQVVFPSGNQYESRAHANLMLYGKDAKPPSLRWKVQPDDRTASFLELWMLPQDATNISIRLKSPSGKIVSKSVRVGGSWRDNSNGKDCCAAIFFPKNNAMSSKSAGALIALASTASTEGSAVCAEHGIWEVWLSTTPGYSGDPITIEAYIERDDTFTPPIRGRQSYFIDDTYERINQRPGQPTDAVQARIKREGSMNTVITGELTIAVGAYFKKELRPSYYSGSGEVRISGVYKPRISAVGDDSVALAGVRSIGASCSAVFRLSGTSVAAPQVTRQIALTMANALLVSRVAGGLNRGVQKSSANSAANGLQVDKRQKIDKLEPSYLN